MANNTRTLRFDKFEKGLWLAGSVDSVPEEHLRRARGIHSVPTAIIRSRDGDIVLYDLPAHSLYRFDDERFQGVATSLYKDGTVILSGLSGERLAFVRMPPTIGIVDYLFIAGGGLARKISPLGDVTQWGIDAPPDGFTAVKDVLLTKSIDAMNASASNYTAVDCVLSDESTIKAEGSGSLKMVVEDANITATATRAVTLNLNEYAGPIVSADGDNIDFWVRIEDATNVEYVAIRFDFVNGAFSTNYATYKCVMTTTTPATKISGVGDIPGLDAESTATTDGQGAGGVVGTTDSVGLTVDAATDSTISNTTSDISDIWQNIRIPKSLFIHNAVGGSEADWATTLGVQLIVKTGADGGATVYWDFLKLSGSTGMSGTYKYLVTYRDSVTGTRSLANETPVSLEEVNRQSVTLASLPISSDPQVDQREVWRTVGNGARYWRCLVIDNNTATTIVDDVSDYVGMRLIPDDVALEATELPSDNITPADTFGDTWGPWQGRVWWCANTVDGSQGLVYYSPAGRAEAVQGFIRVSNNDDPTMKGIIWNGKNYVLTEGRLYAITNTTEPFLSNDVLGSPGTTHPETVVSTPYGIVYQASDTIRIFNGLSSVPLNPDGMLPLLRGQSIENLTAFKGVVATYARDEYIISDGTQTLACNLRTKRWRDLGVGCTALYTEKDAGDIIAAIDGQVKNFESRGVPGDNVSFDIRTGAANFGSVPTVVERVIVNSHTADNLLAAILILDSVELPLGTIQHTTRSTDVFTVGKMCLLANVGLVGTVDGYVEVYSIGLEVREIPLYVLQDGKFVIVVGQPVTVSGNVIDIGTGISYYGIDSTISFMNMKWVPEVRRIYVDVDTHGEELTPVLELYNSTVTLPPLVTDGRRIESWDVNIGDRLISLRLDGDFRAIQLYQVAIDMQSGEEL